MKQTNEQLDRLDEAACKVARGDDRFYRGLSKGERLYVAVAANRHDLLHGEKYRMVQAIAGIDSELIGELFNRWRYKNPSDLRSDD